MKHRVPRLMRRFALLIAGAWCLQSPAFADCFGACYSEYASCSSSADANLGMCAGTRDICLSQCRGGSGNAPARPLAPPNAWAYIVFDTDTGRWGGSSQIRYGQTAMGEARERCRKAGGRRCDFHLSGQDGCVAVAEGDRASGRTGYRTSRSRGGLKVVRQHVLAECTRGGGRNCKVIAQVCSWD